MKMIPKVSFDMASTEVEKVTTLDVQVSKISNSRAAITIEGKVIAFLDAEAAAKDLPPPEIHQGYGGYFLSFQINKHEDIETLEHNIAFVRV